MTFNVICKNCKHTFTISFKSPVVYIGEYAMALDQKLSEPCPDCGKTELKLQ